MERIDRILNKLFNPGGIASPAHEEDTAVLAQLTPPGTGRHPLEIPVMVEGQPFSELFITYPSWESKCFKALVDSNLILGIVTIGSGYEVLSDDRIQFGPFQIQLDKRLNAALQLMALIESRSQKLKGKE